jgi:hypothetical protein
MLYDLVRALIDGTEFAAITLVLTLILEVLARYFGLRLPHSDFLDRLLKIVVGRLMARNTAFARWVTALLAGFGAGWFMPPEVPWWGRCAAVAFLVIYSLYRECGSISSL